MFYISMSKLLEMQLNDATADKDRQHVKLVSGGGWMILLVQCSLECQVTKNKKVWQDLPWNK